MNNNETPQSFDNRNANLQQEVVRQQIAAEQAEENARFLASENTILRNRVADTSNNILPMIGFLAVIGAIVAAFVFLSNSNQEARQEAAAARQQVAVANSRANTAMDAAYRSGQRSQAASAQAQQATNAAIRAEQNSQQPPVIITAPQPQPAPPTVIVTPAEPAVPTPAPADMEATPEPTTTVPDNSEVNSPEQKPLEGKIE